MRAARKRLNRLRSMLGETFAGWWEDKAPRLGAALAYYTVLSLAPLLVLVTPLAGAIFGRTKARAEIVNQFGLLVGPEGAAAVEAMLATASEHAAPNPGAKILSLAVLIFGASGVFAELQEALDTIWEVAPKPGRGVFWDIVYKRLLSFAMVLGICFLLMVSLVMAAVLATARTYANEWVQELATLWTVMHDVVSFGVITLLFAMIYKVLPDVTLRWRDVWVGAALTAGLFTLGRYLIGEFLGKLAVGARYGATGSLVVVLVWVYYSAQILYLGAEFTKVYSRRTGAPVVPEAIAVPVTAEALAQQGITPAVVVEAVEAVVEQKEAEAAAAEQEQRKDDA